MTGWKQEGQGGKYPLNYGIPPSPYLSEGSPAPMIVSQCPSSLILIAKMPRYSNPHAGQQEYLASGQWQRWEWEAQTSWMALMRTDPSHKAEKADKIRQGVWAQPGLKNWCPGLQMKPQRPGPVILIRQMEPRRQQNGKPSPSTLHPELARFIAIRCLMTEVLARTGLLA